MPTQKIVFVTGASTGFGAAIARRFVAEGDRVVASARRAAELAELAAELGPNLLPISLDVRDRTAVEQTVADLPAEFADVDLLVLRAQLVQARRQIVHRARS